PGQGLQAHPVPAVRCHGRFDGDRRADRAVGVDGEAQVLAVVAVDRVAVPDAHAPVGRAAAVQAEVGVGGRAQDAPVGVDAPALGGGGGAGGRDDVVAL